MKKNTRKTNKISVVKKYNIVQLNNVNDCRMTMEKGVEVIKSY